MNEANNRIAKNTLLLYSRTFITIIVGIYTGRVMLQALGVDNYGIYTVVGGIIGFTSIITGTMTGAATRYITYSLGEGDEEKLKNTFVTSINAQIILGIIAITLLEIFGVYWLNKYANIPSERIYAANWVLQCSIVGLFFSLLAVPYRSCIVAHEKLAAYAYITILEVLLRLAIVYAIINYGGDRLILLSILGVLVSILITLYYCIYARVSFNECRYQRYIHKPLLKQMVSYSGWNLFGNSTWILNNQGISMLINVFYGVTFNAARGIANTVNGSIQGFVNNFIMAFNPQIIKSYAAKEYERCYDLANTASRITWLLMLIFIVPICIEADALLGYWLVKVPIMSGLFLRLAMFESLAQAYAIPLYTIIQANGNIKRYTIEASSYAFLVFPLTWIAYKFGAPVWISYCIFIFIYFTLVIFRFKALSKLTTYRWQKFVTKVLCRCIATSICAFILPLGLSMIWHESLIRFIGLSIISVIWTIGCILLIGLTSNERKQILYKVAAKFQIKK